MNHPVPTESVPDAPALALLPEPMAREHLWLPYYSEQPEKTLHVACIRVPGHQLAGQLLKVIEPSRCDGEPWTVQWHAVACRERLSEAINTAYEGSWDVERLTRQCDGGGWPASRWLDALINDAVHRRASDIHLLPDEHKVFVQYRIDGQMVNRLLLPIPGWRVLLSRLKVLSTLDVTEHRRPQEGAFERCIHGHAQSIRSAFLPYASSEKVTLRLLRSAGSLPALKDIFVVPEQHSTMVHALQQRNGLIVVAGATGSGKTTTLYSCLLHWLEQGLNLITLEDPVEIPLPGLCQSEINAAVGYSFSAGLRAALRHDPDALMVGEIRDAETCALALRSATTGHPVLASVHANNAVGVFHRLMGLGATLMDLQQCVNTVIVQRLARAPCHCLPDHNDEGIPCVRCSGTGYFGRVAVIELFKPGTEFFEDPSMWPSEQQRVDETRNETVHQLHRGQLIDQRECDRLYTGQGGHNAQIPRSFCQSLG